MWYAQGPRDPGVHYGRLVEGGVEAQYSEEGTQSGWISRLLEGNRGISMGRFRLPGLAEIEYRDRQGRLVSCEHGLRRVTRTEVDGTITVLADIIFPKDEISGSASEAGVPAFIEFMVKDIPSNQVPMRGGLRWLDIQSQKRFSNPFIKCKKDEQLALVDDIAYPEKAKPEMMQRI